MQRGTARVRGVQDEAFSAEQVINSEGTCWLAKEKY